MVEYKDRGYISPSEIAAYIYDPCYWYINYFLGISAKDKRMPSAWRGNAVEDAMEYALQNDCYDPDMLTPIALHKFEEEGGNGGDDEWKKIPKYINVLSEFLREANWGVPEAIQEPMRRELAGATIFGLKDFVFENNILDLKTTGRMPSFFSVPDLSTKDKVREVMKGNTAHLIQVEAYTHQTNYTPQLLYVSPAKAKLYTPSDVDRRHAYRYMERVVSLIKGFQEEDIKNWVPKDLWDYRWDDELREAAIEEWNL